MLDIHNCGWAPPLVGVKLQLPYKVLLPAHPSASAVDFHHHVKKKKEPKKGTQFPLGKRQKEKRPSLQISIFTPHSHGLRGGDEDSRRAAFVDGEQIPASAGLRRSVSRLRFIVLHSTVALEGGGSLSDQRLRDRRSARGRCGLRERGFVRPTARGARGGIY